MSGRRDNERDFERFLAGEDAQLSAIYRKLPGAEPNGKLDAAVLSLARRAVGAQHTTTPRRHSAWRLRHGWVLGLGSAAGLVLAAGIAWQLRTTIERDAAPTTDGRAMPAQDVVIVSAIERRATPASTLPESAAPSTRTRPTEKSAAAASADRTTSTFDKETQPQSQAAIPRRNDTRQRRETQDGYTLSFSAAKTTPQPAPLIKRAEKAAIEPFSADVEASTQSLNQAEMADAETAAPLVSTNSVERKAELATGANRANELAEMPKPTAERKLKGTTVGAAPSRSATLMRNTQLKPKDWVVLMKELVRDGRDAEARENLALFLRKYPRYPLPDEIKALAPP